MSQLALFSQSEQHSVVMATHWACGHHHCATCADKYWKDPKQFDECGFWRLGKWVLYQINRAAHCETCCPCLECENKRETQRENDADPHLAWRRSKRAWPQDGAGMSIFGDLCEAIVALHQDQPPTDHPRLKTNLEEMAFAADEQRPNIHTPGKPSTQQSAAMVVGQVANVATRQSPEDLKRFFRGLGGRR